MESDERFAFLFYNIHKASGGNGYSVDHILHIGPGLGAFARSVSEVDGIEAKMDLVDNVLGDDDLGLRIRIDMGASEEDSLKKSISRFFNLLHVPDYIVTSNGFSEEFLEKKLKSQYEGINIKKYKHNDAGGSDIVCLALDK
jgi:hypothetical protein